MSRASALIVGNGHSSVNPYASRLVKDSDVFRLNKFFLEPSPIFGRKVEVAFFGGEPFLIYLYDYLISKGIYSISHCIYRELSHKRFFIPPTTNKMRALGEFSKMLELSPVDGFKGSTCLDCPRKSKVTSGVFLIHIAMALGYKKISIVGIDFYSDNLRPYPVIEPDSIKRIKLFSAKTWTKELKENGNYLGRHSLKADSQYMRRLALTNSDVCFNVFIDEDRSVKFWNEISKNIGNIKINRMPSISKNKALPCFLEEIDAGVDSYKRSYYWKDKYMNFVHVVFHNKRAVVINSYYVLYEWLVNLWRSIGSSIRGS